MQQAGQARERTLDALLGRIDIPLPDSLVHSEVEARRNSLDEQLERSGRSMADYLESASLTEEQLDADIVADARRSVKAGFVLDELARQEDLNVEQEELNAFVIEQAYRMGVQPDRLAQELVDRGQIGSAVAEVLRAKALSLLTERAKVTDEAGQPVDVAAALRPPADADADSTDAAADTDEAAADEATDEPAADEAGPEEAADEPVAAAGSGASDQPPASEPAS
jgi:FKBP-type peptidyl-prolyl cis-trans isomerase (trigger factor)